MIRFSCICSQLYELPDDQAGTSFQCRACGRLVEVPTLSELAAISPDGTYKIDATPEPRTIDQQITRINDLERIYTRSHTDRYGQAIDLRTTPEEVAEAGIDEIPLQLADEVKPAAPKYDPITGELVRPLDLKADRATSDKGIWTGPPLHYRKNDDLPFQASQIIPELFNLPNMAVICGVFCVHLLMALMIFPLSLGFLFLGLFYLVFAVALVAHYANVIEDIGPLNKDELPRPFRELDVMDDIGSPFFRFMLALLVSYGVAVAAYYLPSSVRAPYLVAVGVFGTIVFPALFLTTVCSGSVLNLRPDRVIRVIKACGGAYVLLIGGWLLGSVAYVGTFAAINLSVLHFFDLDRKYFYDWYLNPAITFPALLLAVIFMHAVAWYLGLQYRYHAGEFDWALQVHERDPNLPKERGFEVQRAVPPPDPFNRSPHKPSSPSRPTPRKTKPPPRPPSAAAASSNKATNSARPSPTAFSTPSAPNPRSAPTPPKPLPLPPPDDHFDIDELLKP